MYAGGALAGRLLAAAHSGWVEAQPKPSQRATPRPRPRETYSKPGRPHICEQLWNDETPNSGYVMDSGFPARRAVHGLIRLLIERPPVIGLAF
jgi:hypothetical protein